MIRTTALILVAVFMAACTSNPIAPPANDDGSAVGAVGGAAGSAAGVQQADSGSGIDAGADVGDEASAGGDGDSANAAGDAGEVSDAAAGQKLVVYKSAGCECCDDFVVLAEERGFDVEMTVVDDLTGFKQELGIPDDLWSCHTSVIGDYFVEGHMPFEAIDKLLVEQPDIAGITLPGMPIGSPGMPGPKEGPFVVMAVAYDGTVSEFGTW
jgi:hypothetical protein